MQEKKLSMMIRGHEIWLESPGIENRDVELSPVYGHDTAFVDMGTAIWSQTRDGYNQSPKFQFKNAIYARAFHQMAKTVISVRDAGAYKCGPLHGILEIVPQEPICRVGKETELAILHKEKPLESAEIRVVSKKEVREARNDERGRARIPITVDGEHMFPVRHVDPTKMVNEEFDESVFVNTRVLEAR